METLLYFIVFKNHAMVNNLFLFFLDAILPQHLWKWHVFDYCKF